MSGERVLGGYVLRRVLGRGGMGEVHLATTPTGGLAAVKVIHPSLARDPAFRRRFDREVTAARRVARFCTAPVLDAGIDGDVAYLVTEYVKGPDLAQAVRDQGPLSGSNLEALAVGIATALSAIHGAGVIHRDLKPSNVLLSPLGPRVIDFGIAQLIDTESLVSQAILGTPSFMAPEQARGEPLTPATDVFAWGGVIAFAGTGRHPFGAGAPGEVLYRIVNEEPRLDGLDDGVRGVVERALAKDPRARPTVTRLLGDLLGGTQHSAASATQVVERTWSDPPSTTAGPPSPPAGSSFAPTGASSGFAGSSSASAGLSSGFAGSPAVPAGESSGFAGSSDASAAGRTVTLAGPPAGSARRRKGWVLGGVAVLVAVAVGVAVVVVPGLAEQTWPYETDFADSWAVGSSDGGSAAQDASGYVLTVKDGWRLWKSAPRREPGGVVVSARATLQEGSGEYGVWCHGAAGSGDRYEFSVSGSGKASIVKRRTGQPGEILYGPAAARATKADRVVAECAGSGDGVILRMWLNEGLVAEVTDTTDAYGPSEAGVHAAPDAGGAVRVRFESFALRPAKS
ncbi:serine/threonine protein kinase [Nonomuraea glycinis]|uniref:serine/threonine-protein kinase n=1 Tax=Nonomuraea glycinis TaxID=2047744 RepID=UPI001CD9E8D0|nr:serine/threonine-protein kinase [Nonomuraea glycinis]MCA2175893.1 serine/threonine protein kinase [Nonomuraea glycinis]